MAITGCTDNYYTYNIQINLSGDTINPLHPVFTDGDNPSVGAQQCNSVTIGGSGLNN